MTEMTGEEKAGLLLLSLNPRVADTVLTRLGPAAKSRLVGHMQRLEASPRKNELVDQVLQEAEKLLRRLTLSLVGGDQPDGSIDNSPRPSATDHVVGDDSKQPAGGLRIARLGAFAAADDADSENENGDPDDPVAALNRVAQERLMQALDSESPRTIALILNCLAPEKAGSVFKELQPGLRRDVSVQLGTSAMPGTEIVQRTVRAMLAKEQSLPAVAADAKGDARFKKIAQLLRKLERADRAESLTALQERDAEAAKQVREFLYTFEDILCLDGRSLQKVLGELDGKTLALAMKGASEEIMAKVMENMSKRAREGLTEEMEFLTSAPQKEIRQAQKAIVDVIQKLDQAGEIVLSQ